MKLDPRRRESPDLNLTPLIDVVLLLVIFFMVSTTFVDESRLRVELPSASQRPTAVVEESVVVTVTAEGAYRVNEQPLVDATAQTLERALEKVGKDDRDQPVVIRADGRASHQSVVTAMDVVARTGFSRVNIATVSEEE
ncbi:MAG: ExbD/TolR family protein [Steroidobacteraceae bacterium]